MVITFYWVNGPAVRTDSLLEAEEIRTIDPLSKIAFSAFWLRVRAQYQDISYQIATNSRAIGVVEACSLTASAGLW
jgi:hypothetical protein